MSLANLARSVLFRLAPPVSTQLLLLRMRDPGRQQPPQATGDARVDAIVAEIAKEGIAGIPNYLTEEESREAIADFEAAALSRPNCLHVAEDSRLYGIEKASPVAARFFADPLWRRLAESYTRRPQIVFCTMANRIDHDGTAKLGSGGDWHRDGFARELKVILYLTDVGEENGPFQFIRGSHRLIAADMKTARLGLLQNRVGADSVRRLLEAHPVRLCTVTARAGTAIIADDSGIHRGAPIRSGSRYALSNYIFAAEAITPHSRAIYEPMLDRCDFDPPKLAPA